VETFLQVMDWLEGHWWWPVGAFIVLMRWASPAHREREE
jgi:hypothetical protein